MKPPAATSSSASSRGSKRAGWWTHGLPPKSGTVTTDAAQRLAAIGGTGQHDFRAGWTGRRATRGPRTAGRRGSRGAGARQQPSRPRGHGLGPSDSPPTGADVWARPAAPAPGPRPLCPSPGRSPRSPSRGTGSAPPRGGDRPARQLALAPRLFRAVGSRGRGRRTVADAPSAPNPLTVLCVPTRCRVPVPAVPDRLETSSAAAALRASPREPGGGGGPRRVVALAELQGRRRGTVSMPRTTRAAERGRPKGTGGRLPPPWRSR